MTIIDLKKYIHENNCIKFVLEQIGCHHTNYHSNKGYYTCGNYNGDNICAITVRDNEYLNCVNYTRKLPEDKSDLISLVQYNLNLSLPKAVKHLHDILGLKFEYNKPKKLDDKKDILHIFKKVKRKRCGVNSEDVELYDDGIIKEYIQLPHILWIREGILPFTCDKFKIGYSADKKRIIIPERWWCGGENDFLGIIGRTTIEQYEMLDIPKYLAIKPFSRSINLYGLQENYESILKEGFVVVAESQKSVLKRHSRKDETVVAVGTSTISEEQLRILIGLNVEVVVALDKGIDINHIRAECEKFYKIRKVSYIYDKYDLLKDKEAPMDAHDKVYKHLLKYRIMYDEKEHLEYLKYLESERKK